MANVAGEKQSLQSDLSDVIYDVSIGPKYSLIASWIGSGKRVLDVGCGTGAFAERLIQLGNDVNGVEESKEHAEIAATRIQVYDGDFLELTINERFDLVLFADVLEHMHEPDQALKKARSLSDKIIVCVPNSGLFVVRLLRFFGVRKMRTGILDKTHVYSFTKGSIVKMLRDCGWAIAQYASPAPKRIPRW